MEDKWRPSGLYMETDIHIIYAIYTYHNLELNKFIDKNKELTVLINTKCANIAIQKLKKISSEKKILPINE